MGVVPHEQLVNSIAPFQDAASIMWGPWAAYIVSLGIIISSIGALNGWTLLMAQVPMAAAQDGLFPPLFGRLSPRGVPAIGIIVSAGLATVLLVVQASGSPRFATVYNLIVSLSTMTAVIPYAFCALAGGLIGLRSGKGGPGYRIGAVEIVAFLFSVFTLYGCGATAVLYGLMLLILGIPVYVWQQRRAAVSDRSSLHV
jgi:basic amino acid/polyamine antiporter, APA family